MAREEGVRHFPKGNGLSTFLQTLQGLLRTIKRKERGGGRSREKELGDKGSSRSKRRCEKKV